MHIVVLADTHMPRRGRVLPPAVLDELPRADLIIHLGDVTHCPVIEFLESFAPVRGVQGNNDSEPVRARFPLTDRLLLEGSRIALLHGHLGGRTALQAARAIRDADLVLFGHSHRPYNAREDGRVLFNPGSPTDPRWSPYAAFGLLDLTPGMLAAEIMPLP